MEFAAFLGELLLAILIIATPITTFYVIKLLIMISSKIYEELSETIIADTLAHVHSVIESVVLEVSQTYVDSLKESGTFDDHAQQVAFSRAKEKIMSIVSEEAISILSTIYGNLDAWLDVQIESTVKNLKS